MFASLLILLVLPIADFSRIRGNHFKPLSRIIFWILCVNFFILMWIGSRHAEAPYIFIGQVATALYFSYFLIIVPVTALIENTLVDLNFNYAGTHNSYNSNSAWGGNNIVYRNIGVYFTIISDKFYLYFPLIKNWFMILNITYYFLIYFFNIVLHLEIQNDYSHLEDLDNYLVVVRL